MTELARGRALRGTVLRGTVTAFDEAVGLGRIETEDGSVFAFHCIEIADGTRAIDVGTEVTFEPLAKFGRWEAAAVRT